MIFKALLTLQLLFGFSIYACEITSPRMLIMADKATASDIQENISFKNCTESQITKVSFLMTDFTGEMNQRILTSETGDKNLSLSKSFTITSLNQVLNERIHLPKKWKIITPKTVGTSKRIFSVGQKDSIEVACTNCSHTGAKNIQLIIKDPVSMSSERTWLTAEVAIEVMALVSKDNISVTNTALNPESFQLEKVYSSRPETFFTFTDKLPFYRAVRNLKAGEVVKYNDVLPLSLVQAGLPVKLNLNSGNIKLESKAIPMKSGRLGEIIQLKNTQSNKIIIGKVTNFNEVEIEL